MSRETWALLVVVVLGIVASLAILTALYLAAKRLA